MSCYEENELHSRQTQHSLQPAREGETRARRRRSGDALGESLGRSRLLTPALPCSLMPAQTLGEITEQ